MKKRLLFAAAACLAISFTACKKDNTPNATTQKALLAGKWKSTFTADDANNNGSIDASEKVTPTTHFEYLMLNSDGTYVDSLTGSISFTFGGTWSVTSDAQYINFNTLGATSGGKLTQLDAGNLVIQDTSTTPISWTGYVHY